MVKLGAIKFGAPLPASRPPPAVPQEADSAPNQPEASAEEEMPLETQETEEEQEQARKRRITAKLAGMGGMRFGMLPPGVGGDPQQRPSAKREASGESADTVSPPPPPQRVAPARPPPSSLPHETDSEHESQATSDDGVKVEAEESELEEVSFEDAQDPDDIPPPVPTRGHREAAPPPPPVEPPTRRVSQSSIAKGGRPPVPITPTNRRFSTQRTSSRKPSEDSTSIHQQSASSRSAHKSPSEYVMVEDPETFSEEPTPPPPPRPNRAPPTRGAPPPPPPPPPQALDPSDSVSSQWELPSIPSATLDLGKETGDMSLSTWSDDFTSYPVQSPPPPPAKATRRSSQLPTQHETPKPAPERQMSADDLMAVWGRVGVQICEVATALFEKSKKSLVGDGTHAGFVDAVLAQVPNAALVLPPSYGYVIYVQAGPSVQKRASDIMPGDVVALYDARLKGHKGIHTYHQTVGAPEPLVGIISEFEPKKSKIRVFQANQHVGQQVSISRL